MGTVAGWDPRVEELCWEHGKKKAHPLLCPSGCLVAYGKCDNVRCSCMFSRCGEVGFWGHFQNQAESYFEIVYSKIFRTGKHIGATCSGAWVGLNLEISTNKPKMGTIVPGRRNQKCPQEPKRWQVPIVVRQRARLWELRSYVCGLIGEWENDDMESHYLHHRRCF